MRKAYLIAPLITLFFFANLASAQTPVDTSAQEGVGGGSGDMSSAGYQAKTAAADPAVGTSGSSNYIYDHGTVWFDDESVEELPAPTPSPIPTGGGNGGGSSSGSGWLGGLFSSNPQVGGISPEVDVPFTDMPEVVTTIQSIPTATQAAVKVADAPEAINRALANPQSSPHIIRLVDDTGIVRELNIVLFKRIVPWPLWIALVIVILGALAIIAFVSMRGAKDYFLWIGGVLILIGVVTGIVVRFAYRAVPIDPKAITSINIIAISAADMAVKKLMADLPLGVHVIEVTDSLGKKALTVKVFITPALPI